MGHSAEKTTLALQAVLIAWERSGESGELFGSPADLYEQARAILASEWFARAQAEAATSALRDAATAIRGEAKYEGVRGQRIVEMCAVVVDRLAETRDIPPAKTEGGTGA